MPCAALVSAELRMVANSLLSCETVELAAAPEDVVSFVPEFVSIHYRPLLPGTGVRVRERDDSEVVSVADERSRRIEAIGRNILACDIECAHGQSGGGY